jgi:MGT family glycosyltransferase
LQLGAEGFEYPRSDLPSIVRYVGPPTPLPDPDWQQPAWWPELQSGKTVVLVNQGTVATDSNELLRPSLDALASDDDLLVVAVTGGPDPAVLEPLPANARVERFIPFDQVLPHVDLFVTNGGFGGVQLALADGIPIVAAGRTEDKPEVNARIAYAGVGIDLKTQTPRPEQVREAVRRVLTDDRFTRKARQLRDESPPQAASIRQRAFSMSWPNTHLRAARITWAQRPVDQPLEMPSSGQKRQRFGRFPRRF